MILPSHIAIIMDGNGRWGLKKYNDRNKGHYYGLQNINKVIENCINLKIKYLTLYTFSTENWNRPKKEIDYLFYLFKYFYKKNFNKINKNNIRIKFIGDLKNIPKDIKIIIKVRYKLFYILFHIFLLGQGIIICPYHVFLKCFVLYIIG
jgi:undecaprenyl diphosphate synthase